MQRKRAVRANGTRIECASCSIFAFVMSDRMKRTCRIVPGNGGARINVNEGGGVIGGERTNGNAQGGGSRYR
jgi:hypothetical protein